MRFSRLITFLLSITLIAGGEPVNLTAQTANNKVYRRDVPTSPRPYLHLPVYVDPGQPPVEKLHLSPDWGTGYEGLPGFLRSVLLPETHELSPAPDSGFSVKASCFANKMHVEVPRNLLGNDAVLLHLKLGSCSVSSSAADHVYFEYNVDSCGTQTTMINGRLAYLNNINYDPPRIQGSIRRAVPFTLPVTCFYNRYHYSYKVGYTPKLQMKKIYKSMQNRLDYTLSPRNAQWQPLSPSDQYFLGSPMYFQAESSLVSENQRLYLHLCFVTPEQTFTASTIKFSVVENYGCMVESKSSRSRFIPYTNNIVRFTVDAFMFNGYSSQVYMHCTMSVGSNLPTATSKSCNYDKSQKRWVELHGSDSVCSCCESMCITAHSEAPRILSSAAWPIEPDVKQKKNVTSVITMSTSPSPSSTRKLPTTSSPSPSSTRKLPSTSSSSPSSTRKLPSTSSSSPSSTRKLPMTSSRTKMKPPPTMRSRKVFEGTGTQKPTVASTWTSAVTSAVTSSVSAVSNPIRGRGLKRVEERWTDGFAVVEEVAQRKLFEDVFDFRE